LLLTTFAALNQTQTSESVIPVPLHPSRLKMRGFNQAAVLAQAISSTTGLYLDTTSLIRVKASDPRRAGMDAIARARSVREAFRVRAPRLIENRAVLLLDDVMTSGATVHEISQTLLSSGARAVSVLTLARAASHFS
jgi:ComF family protein